MSSRIFAVSGDDDLRVERFHHFDRAQRIGNADEWPVVTEAFDSDRSGK